MLRLLVVCIIAGLAAGIGTGFAGLSAATVIAPMLIAFLGYPWYESVGIGLAADVFASALSAYIYRRNKNVDIRNGAFMVVSILVMTVVGSYFSQYLPDEGMGIFSILALTLMGLKFIIWPSKTFQSPFQRGTVKTKTLVSLGCGAFIGFYCGFVGIGGGLMMLFVLTIVLGYDVKKAVGTSVFVMTFTALTGAVSHFYFGDAWEYLPALGICAIFTLLGAVITSHWANHMDTKKTDRATGVVLLVMGLVEIFESFF